MLIRWHRIPVGWIDVVANGDSREVSCADLRASIAKRLGNELLRVAFLREFMPEEAAAAAAEAAISVIICTRDRPEHLAACLESVFAQEYQNYEVIVVDNASTDDRTRAVVQRTKARHVREPRVGLDHARNCGITAAGNEIVAFIDDDARADSQWLRQINRAFRDPQVMAVTGLVLPRELDTEAQVYFERVYGGMGKGFARRSIHRDSMSARELLWASAFGVGANMAFRRGVFEAIGMFDPVLDVGTPARGGGDVEFLHRLVAHGHLLSYEPEVMVWHLHRRDDAALRRQIVSNGCSVVPFLMTCVRNKTVAPHAVLKFLAVEILGWWLLKRFIRPGRHHRGLIFAEFLGLIEGAIVCWKTLPRTRTTVDLASENPRTQPAPPAKESPATAGKARMEGCAVL